MLLNVLKIIGLALGAISGVVAALKETKTADKKHLTPAGKTLLALGIVGFLLALGAQLKEWQEKESAEEASRKENTQMLREIRDAVTKLETVSMDVQYPWLLDQPDFAAYKRRRDALIRKVLERSPDAGQIFGGLRVDSRSSDHISILSASEGSPALPGKVDGDASEFYRRAAQPHIAIYKKPIDSRDFDSWDDGRGADLVFSPKGGREVLFFTGWSDGAWSASYQRTGLQIPMETWSPSGNVISIQGLLGSEAFVYLSPGTVSGALRLWEVTPPDLTFYFNRQKLHIDSKNLKLGQDRWGHPVYSFRFPDKMAN
jgi:hypothetical protein